MKRTAILFTFLLALGCVENREELPKEREQPYCVFLPIDAFNTELYLSRAGEKGFHLAMDNISNDDIPALRFNDEVIQRKEKSLTQDLKTGWYNRFAEAYSGREDAAIRMVYGGISGAVKLYSSAEVAGRSAGEDLSDLFVIAGSEGKVIYPDMNLAVPKHDPLDYPDWRTESIQDYFCIGMVPGAIDIGLTIFTEKDIPPLHDGTAAFFIEIPVTGLDLSGNEVIVVFKGELPPRRSSPK